MGKLDIKEKSIYIVMYHYVRRIKESSYKRLKGLEYDDFKKQIDYFTKKYNVLDIDSFLEIITSSNFPTKPSILLTFDDGYMDHYKYVFPYLSKKNIAGFFYPPVKSIQQYGVLDVNKIHFILEKEHRYFVDLNLDLIDFFREALKITTPTIRSSALNITSSKSQMILDICVNLDATDYIAGPVGLFYLDKDAFKDNNIKLLVHNYISPVYQDIYSLNDSSNNFYPNLSTLDLLFKYGERSRQIILNSGNVSKLK